MIFCFQNTPRDVRFDHQDISEPENDKTQFFLRRPVAHLKLKIQITKDKFKRNDYVFAAKDSKDNLFSLADLPDTLQHKIKHKTKSNI